MPGRRSRHRSDTHSYARSHDDLEDATTHSHTSASPLLTQSMPRVEPEQLDLAELSCDRATASTSSLEQTFDTFADVDDPLGISFTGSSVKSSPHASRDALDDTTELDGPEISPTFLNDADDPIDNSPYAQVRASVSARDDLKLSVNTPRMWFLSLLFAVFGSGTNLFFSLRYPSVTIAPIIALLLVHPLGLLWDRTFKRQDDPPEAFANGSLDRSGVTTPTTPSTPLASPGFRPSSRRERMRLYLAQGRWNEKEHACVYIASNVSFGFAFATDVIVEQEMFYKQHAPIIYQILLVISTQVLGYAVAGLTRRYLVRPSAMIWPSTLIASAMFTTLHKEENKPAGRWRMSRWRFFLIVFLGSVGFYFLPGFLMPALSYFNVLTWFAPDNVIVANLFGVSSGLGLFPLTFDWSQIAFTGSPLIVPFWAALNVVGGLVVVMWFIAPILYYSNVLYSAFMPILSSSIFDKFGQVYDVSKVLRNDFTFDENAYHQYSRVFLPITYVLSYGVQFAALTALMSHTACWHGKDIWRQWRRSLIGEQKYQPVPNQPDIASSTELPRRPKPRRSNTSNGSRMSEPAMDEMMGAEDVHNRLMQRYDDVPVSWYLITGVVMLAIGIFLVEYYPVHLPWYGLLLAIAICAILFIPIGIVMAITNQQSSIYLICQLLAGVLFPGRPVANMIFTTYGYITSTQGLKFTSDLKLGHYMHIPPRTLFNLQMASTILASLTQTTVLNILLAKVPGICTTEAAGGFTCPLARVHFNGSILWGVLGPARFFGPGAFYTGLVWAFPLGLIAPILVYFIAKRRGPTSRWRKVNLPVLFGSLSWIPPATGLNFSVWALVCYTFNYVIKRRHGAWWRKYNMTLSAALDAGVATGVLVVFFGIVQTGLGAGFKWWGTEVFKQGCDWRACPYKTLGPGETFGPSERAVGL